MTITPRDDHHNPHYWLGYLSQHLAHVAADPDVPRRHRDDARKTVDTFLKSPAATDELADHLRREVKR